MTEWFRLEDKCRLLYLIGCDDFARTPVWAGETFGRTFLRDAELEAQKHA
jgi:hypothetical protein